MRERFIDEDVALHFREHAQHPFVGNTLGAQPLHHAHAGALRGHADARMAAHANWKRRRGQCARILAAIDAAARLSAASSDCAERRFGLRRQL
jgi:hypothetical protein